VTSPPNPRFAPSAPRFLAVGARGIISAALGLGLLAPVIANAVPVAAQESVTFSTAEAAPADSVAYLVTTLDDESEQWQLADALLDRAGVGAAIDEMIAEDLADESGEELPLDAFLGGEVAVIASDVAVDAAVAESMGGDMDAMLADLGLATPEAETDGPEAQGFAVVLEPRAPDTAWAAIREAAEEESVEESTYNGTTILYTPPAPEEEDGMAAARVDDLILIGVAPADLEPIIDTLAGDTEAISTLPEFAAAQDALPDDFLMFGLFNGESVADADFGPLETATGGIDTAGFSALTVAAEQAGFRMETVALSGASADAAAATFPSELVGRAPANALFFMSAADLGATGTLDAIGAALLGLAFGMQGAGAAPDPGASPEEAIAAQYEAAAALLGINLQTELFQQLVGEFGLWLAADSDSGQVSGLFATGVENPATVANTLMQLSFLLQGAAGAEAPVTTRDVDGDQVYVVETGDAAGSTFEFGVLGDQLLIGSGDAVARYSAPEGESLADAPRFLAATEGLPAERNALFYVDLVETVPLLEAASEESAALGLDEFGEIEDASESCGNYGTQEEAQAAYDAAEADTFDLDQDFDGEVCEDFFASGASEDEAAGTEEEDPFADVDLSGFEAFALVGYTGDDGLPRTSSLLTVAEE
jgi:hypothetical protein